eukprot:5058270-Amphidinium_carterae.2
MKTLAGRLWRMRGALKLFKRTVSPQCRRSGKIYLAMAAHAKEVDEDVGRYAASQPKWTSRAKLSWRKTKNGRRRARRVGSGVTQSSLPTIHEEEK